MPGVGADLEICSLYARTWEAFGHRSLSTMALRDGLRVARDDYTRRAARKARATAATTGGAGAGVAAAAVAAAGIGIAGASAGAGAGDGSDGGVAGVEDDLTEDQDWMDSNVVPFVCQRALSVATTGVSARATAAATVTATTGAVDGATAAAADAAAAAVAAAAAAAVSQDSVFARGFRHLLTVPLRMRSLECWRRSFLVLSVRRLLALGAVDAAGALAKRLEAFVAPPPVGDARANFVVCAGWLARWLGFVGFVDGWVGAVGAAVAWSCQCSFLTLIAVRK